MWLLVHVHTGIKLIHVNERGPVIVLCQSVYAEHTKQLFMHPGTQTLPRRVIIYPVFLVNNFPKFWWSQKDKTLKNYFCSCCIKNASQKPWSESRGKLKCILKMTHGKLRLHLPGANNSMDCTSMCINEAWKSLIHSYHQFVLAPVPVMILWSNSEFDPNCHSFSLQNIDPIKIKYFTYQNSCSVLASTIFCCDWTDMTDNINKHILVKF